MWSSFRIYQRPGLKSIVKYRNHPSIPKIGEVCYGSNALNFSFSSVQRTQILKETTQINFSKAGQSTDIPTKIIKQNWDVLADFILSSNQSVAKSIFPSSLKNADITPIFKKRNRKSKNNYRPVGILPNVSKIFERFVSINFKTYGATALKIPVSV